MRLEAAGHDNLGIGIRLVEFGDEGGGRDINHGLAVP